VNGTRHLLGRRTDLEGCVDLARRHRIGFYRIVPLSRGFLVFELREAK